MKPYFVHNNQKPITGIKCQEGSRISRQNLIENLETFRLAPTLFFHLQTYNLNIFRKGASFNMDFSLVELNKQVDFDQVSVYNIIIIPILISMISLRNVILFRIGRPFCLWELGYYQLCVVCTVLSSSTPSGPIKLLLPLCVAL